MPSEMWRVQSVRCFSSSIRSHTALTWSAEGPRISWRRVVAPCRSENPSPHCLALSVYVTSIGNPPAHPAYAPGAPGGLVGLYHRAHDTALGRVPPRPAGRNGTGHDHKHERRDPESAHRPGERRPVAGSGAVAPP